MARARLAAARERAQANRETHLRVEAGARPQEIQAAEGNLERISKEEIQQRLPDTPDDVDYVISSVPARFVPQLLEDCITKGVRVLHLFTAGFTETGDAELTDREILAQSRHTTVKVLPKYVKRTTKQIATGTRKRRALRTKDGHLSE